MSDRPDNYFTMFTGDYLRDTMHLTTRQHGAYQLLLMHYYGTGRPLPINDEVLRTIAREGGPEWKVDGPVILQFFTAKEDGYHQKRVDKELASANSRYQRAMAGARGKHGRKQRLSSGQADDKQDDKHLLEGVLNGCSNAANPHPPPTEKSPSGFSSDRRPRSAARGGTAAPPAAGPGWETEHEKWAAFREKLSPGEWSAWFQKARVNGSVTHLLVESGFAEEQVRYRYQRAIDEHFGEHVYVSFDAEKYRAATA